MHNIINSQQHIICDLNKQLNAKNESAYTIQVGLLDSN